MHLLSDYIWQVSYIKVLHAAFYPSEVYKNNSLHDLA